MSEAPRFTDTTDADPDRTDPVDVIEQHRELYERLATADLPISERVQAALDYADEHAQEGDDAA